MSMQITGSSGTQLPMTRYNSGTEAGLAKLPGVPEMTVDQQLEATIMAKVADTQKQTQESVVRLLDVHA